MSKSGAFTNSLRVAEGHISIDVSMIPNPDIRRSRWFPVLAWTLVLLAGRAGGFPYPRSPSAEVRGRPLQVEGRAARILRRPVDSSEFGRASDSILETKEGGGFLAAKCKPAACGRVRTPWQGTIQGHPSLPLPYQPSSHPIPLLL